MSSNKEDTSPPSYTQAISSPTAHTGQTLLDNLTLARTSTLNAAITQHILPLIHQRATQGLPRTTIALIPSDTPLPPTQEKQQNPTEDFGFSAYSSSSWTSGENGKGATGGNVGVIGFSSNEEPHVVRLEGEGNRMEFWKVPDVSVELERRLWGRLNERVGLGMDGGAGMLSRQQGSGREQRERQQEKKQQEGRRGFLGRIGSARGKGEERRVVVSEVDETERVAVKVRCEEICLRTLGEFGLYDTISRQCVIVSVDVRC